MKTLPPLAKAGISFVIFFLAVAATREGSNSTEVLVVADKNKVSP
jgi:hypothetical protein